MPSLQEAVLASCVILASQFLVFSNHSQSTVSQMMDLALIYFRPSVVLVLFVADPESNLMHG